MHLKNKVSFFTRTKIYCKLVKQRQKYSHDSHISPQFPNLQNFAEKRKLTNRAARRYSLTVCASFAKKIY